MGKKFRVVILSNTDLTSSRLFRTVCEDPRVEVCAVAFTTTITSKGGWFKSVCDIFRRTGLGYFIYASFWHGTFLIKERLCHFFPVLKKWFVDFFSLRNWAVEHRIPVIESADFNADAFLDRIRPLKPDLLITRINQILKAPILDLAPNGAWCLHSSFLPRYRGIATEFHSLANGEKQLGFTVFRMIPALDQGGIVLQEAYPIPADISLHALIELSGRSGCRVIRKALDALHDGTVRTVPQSREGASYFSWPDRQSVRAFRKKKHRFIRWHEFLRYAVC